jgi:hypothetical protein
MSALPESGLHLFVTLKLPRALPYTKYLKNKKQEMVEFFLLKHALESPNKI